MVPKINPGADATSRNGRVAHARCSRAAMCIDSPCFVAQGNDAFARPCCGLWNEAGKKGPRSPLNRANFRGDRSRRRCTTRKLLGGAISRQTVLFAGGKLSYARRGVLTIRIEAFYGGSICAEGLWGGVIDARRPTGVIGASLKTSVQRCAIDVQSLPATA
jgi:hypothetical protein